MTVETICLQEKNWSLEISVTDRGVALSGGCFRGLTVAPSPLFTLWLEDREGVTIALDSKASWGRVSRDREDGQIRFTLSEPASYGDVTVTVTARPSRIAAKSEAVTSLSIALVI